MPVTPYPFSILHFIKYSCFAILTAIFVLGISANRLEAADRCFVVSLSFPNLNQLTQWIEKDMGKPFTEKMGGVFQRRAEPLNTIFAPKMKESGQAFEEKGYFYFGGLFKSSEMTNLKPTYRCLSKEDFTKTTYGRVSAVGADIDDNLDIGTEGWWKGKDHLPCPICGSATEVLELVGTCRAFSLSAFRDTSCVEAALVVGKQVDRHIAMKNDSEARKLQVYERNLIKRACFESQDTAMCGQVLVSSKYSQKAKRMAKTKLERINAAKN